MLHTCLRVGDTLGFFINLLGSGARVGGINIQRKIGHLVQVVPKLVFIIFYGFEVRIKGSHKFYNHFCVPQSFGTVFYRYQILNHFLHVSPIFGHQQSAACSIIFHQNVKKFKMPKKRMICLLAFFFKKQPFRKTNRKLSHKDNEKTNYG